MMQTPPALEPVDPMSGLVPYFGGKSSVAQILAPVIDGIPHRVYAEPFVGAGGLFFRRRWRPAVEAINDAGRDVSTLFRVVQRHPDALIATLSWWLASRDDFDRLVRTDPDNLTDIERAARVVFVQRQAFGAMPEKKTWRENHHQRPVSLHRTVLPLLRRAHRRLDGVAVDRLDFERFCRRWDTDGSLFYADPPYLGYEDVYGAGLFAPADHARLAACMSGLQGRVIVSINDTEEARAIYRAFRLHSIRVCYRVTGPRRRSELLCTNFELPAVDGIEPL